MTQLVQPRPKCALIWHDERIGYVELLERAKVWARSMPPAGERVLIFAENCPEWVYAACATWMAKAVLVPVDHLSTAEELAYVINDCEPALLLCSEHHRTTVDRALAMAQAQPRTLTFEAVSQAVDGAVTRAPVEALDVDESRLAAIVYTSGTTGSPKGVMLAFGNLLANIRPVTQIGYFTPESRVLLLLPLHHVLPLAGSLLAPLFAGSTVVFATSLAGQELLTLLRRHRVTVIVGVPRFYDLLHRALRERIEASGVARRLFSWAKRLRSRAFSRLVFGSVHRKFGGALEHLVCGGAALDPATAETFDVLGFRICEGYGMTECAPMITFPRPDAIRIGSTGQALDGCEVRIDDNGEILARGPNVMRGYYRRPDDTHAIVRDGWLHTGDLGRLDQQGYLYVTGRLKEILVLPSGKKLDPGTIETALRANPALRDVGVFLDGETLHALIVPNWEIVPVVELASAEQWLRVNVIEPHNLTVSPYRRILRLTLVNGELPRTRLGKLRRHLLPGIAQSLAQQVAQPSDGDVGSEGVTARLVAFLARQSRTPVTVSSRLQADLGLDSLGRVELSAFLQRAFGVVIPETRFTELETVGALARLLAQRTCQEVENAPQGVSWAELLRPKDSPSLPHSSLQHRLIVHLSRWLVRLLFRTRAQGQQQVPTGPCILVPNHQSYLDGLFVATHLPANHVLATLFYAKEQHVRKSWLRALAQRCNTIIMDPSQGYLGSLQQLAAGLLGGKNLMIFPEGTRSPDGALGPFKDSYAILACELGVPVVPVVIAGAFAALPRGSRIPRLLSPIRIRYLPAMMPASGETPTDFNARVRQQIEAGLTTR